MGFRLALELLSHGALAEPLRCRRPAKGVTDVSATAQL
jgi:hypothetical protein